MGYKDKYFTVMPTDRDTCYLCGCSLKNGYRHFHHCIHGTANRQIADREGLGVYLCPPCHKYSKHAVHSDKSVDMMLEREAQDVWETKYIIEHDCTREEARNAFRELFGKSYIWED